MRASLLLALPLALLTLTPARAARAADPTVPECLTASEASLKLRSEHKLRQARAQVLVCAASTCPAEVREDCTRRMDQLIAAAPTIVFEAKDGAGRELAAVKVTMDGEVVADHLDGTALALDPGSHQFTFETAGQPTVTQGYILHEGEKDRRESVMLGPPVAAPPPGSATPSASTAPGTLSPTSDSTSAANDDSASTRRMIGLVVGGAGLVGLAVGGIFGGLAIASWGSASSECPSHSGCSTQASSDRSNALTYGTVSTVGFIAGGVLLAGGLTLYFTAPKSAAPTVGLEVLPGGLGVTGGF